MSSLKVKQTRSKILKLFEDHLDLSDLNEAEAQRDAKILTRCLAALSVYLETACTPEEAAASVWDGTNDNGIDAAYVDAILF